MKKSLILLLAPLLSGLPGAIVAQSIYEPYRVSTFVPSDSSDRPGLNARYYGPQGVALDNAGNVYVADPSNHSIRRIAQSGAVATLAGQSHNPGSADGAGSAFKFS